MLVNSMRYDYNHRYNYSFRAERLKRTEEMQWWKVRALDSTHRATAKSKFSLRRFLRLASFLPANVTKPGLNSNKEDSPSSSPSTPTLLDRAKNFAENDSLDASRFQPIERSRREKIVYFAQRVLYIRIHCFKFLRKAFYIFFYLSFFIFIFIY